MLDASLLVGIVAMASCMLILSKLTEQLQIYQGLIFSQKNSKVPGRLNVQEMFIYTSHATHQFCGERRLDLSSSVLHQLDSISNIRNDLDLQTAIKLCSKFLNTKQGFLNRFTQKISKGFCEFIFEIDFSDMMHIENHSIFRRNIQEINESALNQA